MANVQDIILFEREVDQKISDLQFWQQPLKTVLIRLFLVVNSLFGETNAVRFAGRRPQAGEALISRISYFAPYLTRCPIEHGGHDEAISMGPDNGGALSDIIAYGHFCELLPEVRRNQYEISTTEMGFSLRHNENVARSEELDVLLIELSLASERKRGPDYRKDLFRILSPWSEVQLSGLRQFTRPSYDHYLSTFLDQPLLTVDAYTKSFGFERSVLLRVRAALFAIADISICISFAFNAHMTQTGQFLQDMAFKKALFWGCPFLPYEDFVDELQKLSALEKVDIEPVLSSFLVDRRVEDFSIAGDGYLPPFVQFNDGLLFNPHVVRAMVQERNLLYVLNKRNRRKFNTFASPALEPSLLDQAVQKLSCLQGVLLARNVVWDRGEIDLLAYEPASNFGLQIQAKAALPPQGARMTRQVEEHSITAVRQLALFTEQAAEIRDNIYSKAFGRQIGNVELISVALSRSGFGSARAWAALNNILAINIQILGGTVQEVSNLGMPFLTIFKETATKLLNDLLGDSIVGWSQTTIKLFEKELEIPLLDLNHKKIDAARVRFFTTCDGNQYRSRRSQPTNKR